MGYAAPSEDDEWMASMREQAAIHAPYAKAGPYMTSLTQPEELAFRQWLTANRVPFNPNDPVADYDMRGFWRAAQQGDPRAITAPNPNDGLIHFDDNWKTPYHQSFSAESQYATGQAPRWIGGDRLQRPDGQIVFDEPRAVAHRKQMGR